jgi:protoporphyrinogen oxidase
LPERGADRVADVDVAVLGAGPAGVFAAWRLALSGRNVVVFERAPQPGGLAASFEVAGVRVDYGSHRLHPWTPPAVMAQLRDLLGDDLQRRTRHGRIVLAGRLVAFPPRPGDLARRLPPFLAARLVFDTARASFRRAASPANFADAVRTRLGPTMLRDFYGPYAIKLFGARADELDPELARRRIGARSGADVLRRARRRDDAGNQATFFSPRRGFGQLVEALSAAAVEAGAGLRTSTPVHRVVATGDHVDVEYGEGASLRARHLWSTLPLPVLASLAGAPDDVQRAAAALEYRSMVLVYLVVPRRQWTEFDAHYFPSLDVPMSRISEPKNYRTNPDDPTDVTVLCAELPCRFDDELWNADGSELARRVADGITRSHLPPVDVQDCVVRRVERAYPVYRLGYAEHFARVDGWADALPRVLTFGRQGLFAHDNTHHAFAMAAAAVDALRSDGEVDAREWSDARDRFREHVVED